MQTLAFPEEEGPMAAHLVSLLELLLLLFRFLDSKEEFSQPCTDFT